MRRRWTRPHPQEKPQLVQIDGALHGTLGLTSYDEMDYKKPIQEYQAAVKDNVKDDASHFFMAYGYINLMVQASTDYQTSLTAENAAKAAKADQPSTTSRQNARISKSRSSDTAIWSSTNLQSLWRSMALIPRKRSPS